jgi:AAA family ATP:ADP antiporter
VDSCEPASEGSPLRRSLHPLRNVRRSEALAVVLLVSCVFLILSSYYAMKTSREGLILARGSFGLTGQELKAYASAVMACLLAAAVPAYAALAARVPRIRLIDTSYVAVIASLAVFYLLARAGLAIGVVFFIWIGLVNLFLVAQFWSYANDLCSEEQGKRLFPIIALGGSLGGVAGPRLAAIASTEGLLVVAALLLVPCLALFHVIERVHSRDPVASEVARQPIRGRGGFSLIWSDRYLTLIAALVFLGALVKTIGEYVLSDAAAQHAAALAHTTAGREEVIKSFYGDFYFWVNLSSFVIQALFVSVAIDRLGVRRALFFMPLIALGAYGAIAIAGSFALVRAAKLAENSTDYSLENTVRQTLFLRTERAAKYNAKTAIDTFAVRAGDTVSAFVIWFGVRRIGLHGRQLAIVNVGLVVVWLVLAAGIVRYHRRRSRTYRAVSQP